jgi:hypothetical protein
MLCAAHENLFTLESRPVCTSKPESVRSIHLWAARRSASRSPSPSRSRSPRRAAPAAKRARVDEPPQAWSEVPPPRDTAADARPGVPPARQPAKPNQAAPAPAAVAEPNSPVLVEGLPGYLSKAQVRVSLLTKTP